MRTIKLLCFLCYSFLTAVPLLAQQNSTLKLTSKDIEINADSSKTGLTIFNLWKYKAGDSLGWSSPDYSDENWNSLKSDFRIDSIPADTWTGMGWFRLKLLPDNSLKNQTVAFTMLQNGASEIYLDGKLVKKFGTVFFNNNEVTHNPRRVPFGIYFDEK